MLNFSHRINDPELMDSVPLSQNTLRETLKFLSFAHRYLGGERVILSHLEKWSSLWSPGEEITFLDVGTGGADVALSLVRWGRKKGFRFRIVGVDSISVTAQIARENTTDYPEISVLEEDFFALGQREGRFDYVVASLFLHHIPDDKLIETLAVCNALAKRGVVIGDLLRSRAAYWAVRLTTAVLSNKICRHDGPLSVRRTFTVPELKALAAKSQLNYLHVEDHPFFRVSLAGEK